MAATPVFKAKSAGKGSVKGPQKWTAGTKLWDTMVHQKHMKTSAKYPGKTILTPDSGNNSMYQCLDKPELFLFFEGMNNSVSTSSKSSGHSKCN